MTKKSKSPAFLFYASDFLVDEDVQSMTNQAVGCYIKLICYCWREGSIPKSVPKIAGLCKETPAVMKNLWGQMRDCFQPLPGDDNRLINPRIEHERQRQVQRALEKSKAGKIGMAKRWGHAVQLSGGDIPGQGSLFGPPDEDPLDDDGPGSGESNGARDKPDEVPIGDIFPEIEDRQLISKWLEIRNSKNLPLTKKSLKAITKQIAVAGLSPLSAIQMCVRRKWGGFKAEWVSNGPAAGPTDNAAKPTVRDI